MVDWRGISYDLGKVNLGLFGFVLLFSSDGCPEPARIIIGMFGIGLVFVGLWLLLVGYAEYLFGPVSEPINKQPPERDEHG